MAEGEKNFDRTSDKRFAPGQADKPATEPAAGLAGVAAGVREQLGEQAKSAAEQVRRTREDVKDKAGEAYDEASDWAREKQRWAKERYGRASEWASDSYEHGAERLQRARDQSGRRFREARGGVQDYVAQNPVVVGLVGLAAGLLLGALLPRTKREDAVFGEFADEARQKGMRYARDMARRGREYVEDSFVGEDPRYGRHEGEFDRGPSAGRH